MTTAVSVGLASLILLGVIYERAGTRRDREALPQIGRSIDIGGRSMNIFCSGEGAPAVVFDSGSGVPGYTWSHIQPQIAANTQACWFDRAGEGWSDPGPFPRTSAATARDLHQLLRRAGVPPPYVLVGHSLGGLNARVYNGLYPSEIAGAVLVDAAHEDEPRRAPAGMRGKSAPRWLWRPIWTAGQLARVGGLLRLASRTIELPHIAARTRSQIIEALGSQPKAMANRFDASTAESYSQAERAGGFCDKPLIVLTRGGVPATAANISEEDRQLADYERVWMHEIQPKLARLSTRGRQVIVTSSGHGIPDDAPDAVVRAIRQIVSEVRGQVPTDPAAPVYDLVFGLTFHAVPGTRMVVRDTTIPMRPLAGAHSKWVRQFDGMPPELLQRARDVATPQTIRLTSDAVPLGTRLVEHAGLDQLCRRGSSAEWSEFKRRFQASGWVAVSRVLWSANGRDALVYYASCCGGLCGQDGYVWGHRDAADGAWQVARSVVRSLD